MPEPSDARLSRLYESCYGREDAAVPPPIKVRLLPWYGRGSRGVVAKPETEVYGEGGWRGFSC